MRGDKVTKFSLETVPIPLSTQSDISMTFLRFCTMIDGCWYLLSDALMIILKAFFAIQKSAKRLHHKALSRTTPHPHLEFPYLSRFLAFLHTAGFCSLRLSGSLPVPHTLMDGAKISLALSFLAPVNLQSEMLRHRKTLAENFTFLFSGIHYVWADHDSAHLHFIITTLHALIAQHWRKILHFSSPGFIMCRWTMIVLLYIILSRPYML